jgi:hypothetical protein
LFLWDKKEAQIVNPTERLWIKHWRGLHSNNLEKRMTRKEERARERRE